MHTALQQLPFRIRTEWGLDGAEATAAAEVAIVVDVLSFSTCVSVAADVGITVLPYVWSDGGAQDHDGVSVAVVAAGERWPGGALRPAVEDLWGAGAVVSALQRAGWTSMSPEAATSIGAFRAAQPDLAAGLAGCASGAELLAMGFGADVAIASELDESRAVPLLGEVGFRDVTRA